MIVQIVHIVRTTWPTTSMLMTSKYLSLLIVALQTRPLIFLSTVFSNFFSKGGEGKVGNPSSFSRCCLVKVKALTLRSSDGPALTYRVYLFSFYLL